MGTSPRQSQSMLPSSRSQTPQQAGYTGFQPNNNPSQAPSQPTPYGHLQHNGSANATPSPVMSNQLRPGSVPQRVATTSPHPFSPAAQQFSAQGSPPSQPSEHGSRVNTPQNQYLQNASYQPGPAYSAPNSIPTPHMQQQQGPPPQQFQQNQQSSQGHAQQAANQKMVYQMRLQQSLAQNNMMAAQRQNISLPPNTMPKPPQMPPMNGQYPQTMRPQQLSQQAPSRPPNPDVFLKNLVGFMQKQNLPVELNPIVGDRSINLVMLYMAVQKFGGYKKVSQANLWGQVTQALQINPSTSPNAPQQVKIHYDKNLLMFEEAWAAQQRQAQMMRQNQPMASQQAQMSPVKQMGFPAGMQQQSPQYLQHIQQQQQQNLLQQQHLQQQALNTPMKQMHPGQPLPSINGYSTPQGSQGQHNQLDSLGHSRNSLSRSMDPSPPQNGTGFSVPSPAAIRKSSSVSGLLSPKQERATGKTTSPGNDEFRQLSTVYEPSKRPLKGTWGGYDISVLRAQGEKLAALRPNVPAISEMGIVDIQAVTLSLQSGIHSEVRYALDTLALLSNEQRLAIDLRYCHDLMESLVDCAEEQVELLAENADEVYDLVIPSYEDVFRGCQQEHEGLQDIPVYGSQEYELDRAVDRLICITTILRNFSFVEWNLPQLADKVLVKLVATVVRYLGTRHMLLRRYSHTLDFMKDVIVLLSNIGQDVILPGKDQAMHLLLFVLAFAPSPPPHISSHTPLVFTPYDPAIHKYLPPAVDCLAKLLARDEPNRTFYRHIFATDGHPLSSFDLLTKTFALAISPVPEYSRKAPLPTIELRKPFLMQGMLAAEILVNLAPGFETGVTRAWLASQDGLATSLMRLVEFLCKEAAQQIQLEAQYEAQMQQQQRGQRRGPQQEALHHLERGSLAMIAQRAIRVLKRLVEKCLDPEDKDSVKCVPVSVWPKHENLLGAQSLRDIDPIVLSGLLGLAKLEYGISR